MQTSTLIAALEALVARMGTGDLTPPDNIQTYSGAKPLLEWYPVGPGQVEEAAAIRRAVGGTWDKTVTGSQLWLTYEDDAFRYRISMSRTAACTKVVTGTTTVTETVPDPEALA